MTSESGKDQIQVGLMFIDKRTILPYEPASIRSKMEDQAKKQIVAIYRSPNENNDFPERDIGGFEKIGTLLKIVNDGAGLIVNGVSINFGKRVLAIGIARVEVISKVESKPDEAIVRVIKDEISKEEEEALKKSKKVDILREKALYLLQSNDKNFSASELSRRNFIYNEENLVRLCYMFAMQLKLPYDESLQFLKLNTVTERVDFLLKTVEKIKFKEFVFDQDFTFDVTNHSDLIRIEKIVQTLQIPEIAKKAINSEIQKLKKSASNSSETTISQNYLEFILGLPWNNSSRDNMDLKSARNVLDLDHSGLNNVKQRIIEFLAVRSLNPKAKGSILCFHGPPGVGKTSLGKSIAKSLGRKYERISLGGVSDETMLRGHRRTYVGAYAGIIIQSIRRSGTKNPVILLDEIDKIGARNYHGDPASALLEILDPQQNNKFMDHYLNIPFDLSSVFFIATANRLDSIHPALLDRMEVINLHGYTIKEKTEIADKYIVRKVEEDHGLPSGTLKFSSDVLPKLIKEYTMEAGVRNLEKKIAAICRNLAVDYVSLKEKKLADEDVKMAPVLVTGKDLEKYLGPRKFKENILENHNQPGTSFGLAWTEVGGKVLLIETSYSSGTGKILLTGQLGEVMRESVSTAISWIKSNYKKLKLNISPVYTEIFGKEGSKTGREDLLEKIDLHVHFPSASTPKDGPSAGTAICLALVSLLTDRKVHSDLALTGEISLTGKILPVGGIKEKAVAATHHGLVRILLPEENRSDFEKMENVGSLEIEAVFVKHIWEVLEIALDSESSGDKLFSRAYLELSKL